MADETLRIKVGADIIEFTKSIAEVETELKGLQESVKNLGGQELVKVNKQIGELTETLQRLKNVGKEGFDEFGVAIKKTGNSAGQTGITLTNLSRIAQDAPFGFIAIQNNLDPLIQSFGNLSKESGGTGNAIKALAGSLVGPAGLALGFSVVTALVTSAIQKYGSLSNAVIALSAAQDQASIKQRELTKAFNESLASSTGDLGKIKDYVGILNNVNASQKERLNAYNILKKDFPSIIQNQTFENALNAEGAKLINEKARQTVDYILLKGKEAALIKLVEKESQKQLDAEQNLAEFRKNAITFTNLLFSSLKAGGNAILGTQYRFRELQMEIEDAKNSGKDFANQLSKIREQFTQTDQGIIDPQAVINSYQEQIKEQNKILKAGIKDRKKAKEQEAKDEIRINKEVVELFFQSVENSSKAYKEQLDQMSKDADAFIKQQESDLQIDAEMGGKVLLKNINKSFDVLSNDIKIAEKNATAAAKIFSDLLNPVIDQFFTNISEGQNAFKGLGNAIKQFAIQALKDLLKIATIAALKAAFSKNQTNFADAFSQLFNQTYGFTPKTPMAPGGMSMNVSGQFGVRGTDLVAVINQSQQRINRVG